MNTMKKPYVSVVVPVYNECDTVYSLDKELRKELADSGVTYEIIYVDDGSTDDTSECLQETASKAPGPRYHAAKKLRTNSRISSRN